MTDDGEGRTADRRNWSVEIGFVVAAALLVVVAWMTTRGTEVDSVPPSSSTERTTTLPSQGSPTAGVPESAVDELWVVTSLDGELLPVPDLPTFTFRGDDTIFGWDGCNEYIVSADGVEQTAAGCPEGVVPVMASPPFTFDSQHELRTNRFTARPFQRQGDEPAAGYPFEGRYRFGAVGGLVLTPGGFVSIESRGCEIGMEARWFVANGNYLTFGFESIPECYDLDSDFVAWLERMKSFGAPYIIHDGPASGLWTLIGDRVTRLAMAP
jgi:hypothetical protein